MKALMTIGLLISSSISLASGVWDITSHTNEELVEDNEISNALIQYPQILAKWRGNSEDIKYIVLTLVTLEWTGETQCEENDSRLQIKAVNFLACPDRIFSINCIYELDPNITPYGDPCKD